MTTTTLKYLQTNWDDTLTIGPEYQEMEKFCMVIADINRYAEEYFDEGTAFYMDDILIDTDGWVHEESEAEKHAAILAYHEVTQEELDAWTEKHEEVAYWVAFVGQFGDCKNDELEEFIDNYNEPTDDEEDA